VAPVPQPAGLALSVLRQRRSADRASCVQQTIVAVGMPHSPKTTSVFERAWSTGAAGIVSDDPGLWPAECAPVDGRIGPEVDAAFGAI